MNIRSRHVWAIAWTVGLTVAAIAAIREWRTGVTSPSELRHRVFDRIAPTRLLACDSSLAARMLDPSNRDIGYHIGLGLDSVYAEGTPNVAPLAVGSIASITPASVTLHSGSTATLYDRKIVRRLRFNNAARLRALEWSLLCSTLLAAGRAPPSTLEDTSNAGWSLSRSVDSRDFAGGTGDLASGLVHAYAASIDGQMAIRIHASHSDRTIALRQALEALDDSSAARLLVSLHNENTAHVLHRAKPDYDAGVGGYFQRHYDIENDLRISFAYFESGNPMVREILGQVPVVGGVLTTLARTAPGGAILVFLAFVLVFIIRWIDAAYDRYLLSRADRQLNLLRLQLDVASSLQRASESKPEQQRALSHHIASIATQFDAIALTLQRRTRTVRRWFGPDAFWRWTPARGEALRAKWRERLFGTAQTMSTRHKIGGHLSLALAFTGSLAGVGLCAYLCYYVGIFVVVLVRWGVTSVGDLLSFSMLLGVTLMLALGTAYLVRRYLILKSVLTAK